MYFCVSKQCLFLKVLPFLESFVYSSIVVFIAMSYTLCLSVARCTFSFIKVMFSLECYHLSYGLCLFGSCGSSCCYYYCEDSYWCLHPQTTTPTPRADEDCLGLLCRLHGCVRRLSPPSATPSPQPSTQSPVAALAVIFYLTKILRSPCSRQHRY